ncbi:hypothetical protein BC833DRAFT_567224 [Globomyces pollinis-pini]|nr:hypothetical protein BC833DRAFT_567224 [Globomyces pollinis-pini]
MLSLKDEIMSFKRSDGLQKHSKQLALIVILMFASIVPIGGILYLHRKVTHNIQLKVDFQDKSHYHINETLINGVHEVGELTDIYGMENPFVQLKVHIENLGSITSNIPLSIPPKIDNSRVAMVTYFAPQANKEIRIHFKDELYSLIIKNCMANIAAYSHTHGIPFFFRNSHLVDTTTKAAYWGKMDVIQHYFKAGYEWVIWTDIDVLFMNSTRSLVDEWIKKAKPEHSLAWVLECSGEVNKYGSVRSGFFAIRNSPDGIAFLDAWKDSHKDFGSNWNPEQEALEKLVEEPRWKNMSYFAPPDGVHTYPECYESYDKTAISIHLVSSAKVRVEHFKNQTDMLLNSDFDISFDLGLEPPPKICNGVLCIHNATELEAYLKAPPKPDDLRTFVNNQNHLGFSHVYTIVPDLFSKSFKSIYNIFESMGVEYTTVFSIKEDEIERIEKWYEDNPTFALSDDASRKISHLMTMKHAISQKLPNILIVEDTTDWCLTSSTLLNLAIPKLDKNWDFVLLYWDVKGYPDQDVFETAKTSNIRKLKKDHPLTINPIAYAISAKAMKVISEEGMKNGMTLEKTITDYTRMSTFHSYLMTPLLVDDMTNTKPFPATPRKPKMLFSRPPLKTNSTLDGANSTIGDVNSTIGDVNSSKYKTPIDTVIQTEPDVSVTIAPLHYKTRLQHSTFNIIRDTIG